MKPPPNKYRPVSLKDVLPPGTIEHNPKLALDIAMNQVMVNRVMPAIREHVLPALERQRRREASLLAEVERRLSAIEHRRR